MGAFWYFSGALTLAATVNWCFVGSLAQLGMESEGQRLGCIVVGIAGAVWSFTLGIRALRARKR
jgi:hypothetical protein